MHFFEIIEEDGFQRRGKIQFSKKGSKVRSPCIVLPINQFLLNQKSYIEFISRNPNVILEIFEDTIQIPNDFSKYNILLSPNYQYYTSNGKIQFILESNSQNISESNEIFYILTRNCPSTPLDEQSTDLIQKQFIYEFKEEIGNLDRNQSLKQNLNQKIGLKWRIWGDFNIEFQIKNLLELLQYDYVLKNISLIDIDGLFNNWINFRDIIESLLQIKNKIPSDIILKASGDIDPYMFPTLTYLGIDLIDGTYLIYAGYNDVYFSDTSKKWKRNIQDEDDITCNCTACLKIQNMIQNNKEPNLISIKEAINPLIALHNIQYGTILTQKIREEMRIGTLRHFLEKTSMNSTFLISAIRYIDSLSPNPIISVQTLRKNSKLICSGSLSYYEPQIVAFRERIKKNANPPQNSLICVLLPCSMVKPYSSSKSHRNFIKILKDALGQDYNLASQAIVTSPLGLVPRELESIYPASHYDISVTGVWDQEEITITAESIKSWIHKFSVDIPIIAFLHGGYAESFKKAIIEIKNPRFLIESSDAEQFKDVLKKNIKNIKESRSSILNLEEQYFKSRSSNEEREIGAIADFQFGIGAGSLLIGSAARLLQAREENFKEIYGYESYGKVYLGRIDKNTGFIQLSYEGGERLQPLAKKGLNVIKLNTDEITGTTIFKPAMDYIDPNLASGDEILILDTNNNYLGVGSLIINAVTALKLRKGPIVKIHKIRKLKLNHKIEEPL